MEVGPEVEDTPKNLLELAPLVATQKKIQKFFKKLFFKTLINHYFALIISKPT